MSAEAGGETFTQYIQHHLTFWSAPPAQAGGLVSGSVHLDTFIMSGLLGLAFVAWFGWFARRATSGVPGKGQAFVELALEFVDGQVRDAWHGSRRFLGPLALTIFFWILLMSLLDVVPVDLVPAAAEASGVKFFRPVATADLNVTFAMSLTVFVLTIFFGLKAKKARYFSDIVSAPFTSTNIVMKVVLAPFNILMFVIEMVTQPVSLALRLFGNIFAGDLLFMLIAGLMGHLLSLWYPLGILGYAVWSLFELLIVLIQAFIFMYLSVTYIAMAQQHH
ncbi:MAG TPA: F0F1 ATP synthase subunit A [Rhodanobacteraceae bacterium]|nr:F0F1 ATP synthase subunit A [Rhodanobacteraceae bacterium]